MRLSLVLQVLVAAPLACSAPVADPLNLHGPRVLGPRFGGTLELASGSDVRSLDPASISDGVAPELIELMYAGLVDYDREGNLVADLAESYARSSDGLSFHFRLRPGLRFHDGSVLEAADVKRSIERAFGPDSPNSSRGFFDALVGLEEFVSGGAAHLAGVEVEGPLDLSLRLSRPDATFERVLPLQTLRPVCPSMGAVYTPDAVPCGAGPFKLAKWTRAAEVSLVRNPHYHVPNRPYLGGVHYRFHVSQLTQAFRFQRGEQDVLREMSATEESRFLADPNWAPYTFRRPASQMNAEGMNTEVPPFDNPDVRRAVSFAINREQFAKLRPTALLPLTQPVPQGVAGHEPALHCQRYDLAEARRLMAKAGYPYDPVTGKGGYPHEVTYLGYRKGLIEYTAQLLKEQLAQIGIRLDLRLVSYSTYLALSHRRHGVGMSYQAWAMDYSDPANFTETLFHSRAIQDDDTSNTSFYRNPVLDRLLDDGKRELDASRRKAIYDRAQEIICADAPWAFTYSIRWTLITQPVVRDFATHLIWMTDLRDTWLERAP